MIEPGLNRPALMGIINVTPDSFSDGGMHFAAEHAISAALRMVEEGADLIDIGGESTRPNAEEVSADEELRRVIPVVSALSERGITLSIDTMKPRVAREAITAGAAIVNDVTAFGDGGMPQVVAETGCIVCLMHMQGTPRTMQLNPTYDNVVRDVREFLLDRASFAERCGITRDKIWIDPGIGFGKTLPHNLSLLQNLDQLVATGYSVLVGVSRKSFIGKALGGQTPLPSDQRLEGTLAAQVIAQMKGAKIIRAHDVKEARRAIDMTHAILTAH